MSSFVIWKATIGHHQLSTDCSACLFLVIFWNFVPFERFILSVNRGKCRINYCKKKSKRKKKKWFASKFRIRLLQMVEECNCRLIVNIFNRIHWNSCFYFPYVGNVIEIINKRNQIGNALTKTKQNIVDKYD